MKKHTNILKSFQFLEDSIIWWTVVINRLMKTSENSMWDVLQYIGRVIPTGIALELIKTSASDLSRFELDEIDRLCQNVVKGSKHPIAAALRIAAFMKEQSNIDYTRGEAYNKLYKSYIK